MCEKLEGMHVYKDGNNSYTVDIPDSVSRDEAVSICANGFREITTLYPKGRRIYCGISPETMFERLKERPGNESERFSRVEDCLRTFSDYFPVSGNEGGFHEVIRTDNANGGRISNTLYSARRLARYIAAQRN
jgi:hypothetical protein